jgi:hypothetical protein
MSRRQGDVIEIRRPAILSNDVAKSQIGEINFGMLKDSFIFGGVLQPESDRISRLEQGK